MRILCILRCAQVNCQRLANQASFGVEGSPGLRRSLCFMLNGRLGSLTILHEVAHELVVEGVERKHFGTHGEKYNFVGEGCQVLCSDASIWRACPRQSSRGEPRQAFKLLGTLSRLCPRKEPRYIATARPSTECALDAVGKCCRRNRN